MKIASGIEQINQLVHDFKHEVL